MNFWRRLDRFLFAYSDRTAALRTTPDSLRLALNVGTTITTRFWVALQSLLLGGQLLVAAPETFSPIGRRIFFWSVPNHFWAGALFVSGMLMLWRVLSPTPRPLWAWASNGLSAFVWGAIVASRIVYTGATGLLAYYTLVWLMATWVLMRTGATRRDVESA